MLSTREGLKELLSPQHAGPGINGAGNGFIAQTLASLPDLEFSKWQQCLDLLVKEFLLRKSELLRLNKARREQIEEFLRFHSKTELALEQAVLARQGSPEQEALQLFAHQSAVFQLLQILLVKRWVDRGLLAETSLKPSGHTLNWEITGFLKRNSKQGMLSRHDWTFLKQNIFSWYSPLKDTWEQLHLLLGPVNLSQESGDFPTRLLRVLGARSRLSLLGFRPTLIDSHALWQLLLEQKASDERLASIDELEFATGSSGAILISGLGNGESLQSLRGLNRRRELHGVWAYADSDFERFLSEMFILWDCASEIPRINLLSRTALSELSGANRSATLFNDSIRLPHQAQLAACFQDLDGKEFEDAVALLAPLRENGLLLVASDQFWPTETSERCERFREQVLKHSAVRLIVDLRQLTGSAGERLPKGVAILEKCESRELRDSNRPKLLRARGHLQSHQVKAFWSVVLEQVRMENNPGEVSMKSLTSVGEGVRLESMAAAASQQQLRSAPWMTLSDPRFYEARSRLHRSLHKAHTFGMVHRWEQGMPPPSRRGILLQEQGKFLQATLPDANTLPDKDGPQYLFVPEASVAEHSSFFLSQVYSAPVQFWFRLETEQTPAKSARAQDRLSGQRLKLMPLLRLFEPGTLLSAPPLKSPHFMALDEVRRELIRIFRQPNRGMAENAKLHEIVLSLESSIAKNISLCAEYTGHLFPELRICRWELPATLPEVAPRLALDIFKHLDSSPLAHHPAIQITKLRSAQDFKVTNSEYSEMPMGGMAELKIFHGAESTLKLTGPILILRIASDELQKRVGRPWRETSERLRFPTDMGLINTQLREVVRSAERQLASTREHIAVMDQIFCCLFGLSPSFTDESSRQAIRHHLSPEESQVHLHFPKENVSVKPRDSEFAKELLQ